MEQYCRDVRVAMIFEGTSFVQSADLIGRKLNVGGGVLMQNYMADLDEFIGGLKGDGAIGGLVEQLESAKNTLLKTTMKIAEIAMEGDLDYVMSIATRYLHMFGEIVVARELIDQAAVATEALKASKPGVVVVAFYLG